MDEICECGREIENDGDTTCQECQDIEKASADLTEEMRKAFSDLKEWEIGIISTPTTPQMAKIKNSIQGSGIRLETWIMALMIMAIDDSNPDFEDARQLLRCYADNQGERS